MGKVVHLNFAARKRVTVLPLADPSYCHALGEHITAKPGVVEIEFDQPVKVRRYTLRQFRAMLDKYEAMAMQAEILSDG